MKKTIRKHLWTVSALAGALAIFLQVNSVALVSVLFSANEQQIVASQCEHKTPHCNGQCFLKKQVKAAAEETGTSSTPNERGNHVPSISAEYVQSTVDFCGFRPVRISYCSNFSESTIAGVAFSVFNPPKGLLS